VNVLIDNAFLMKNKGHYILMYLFPYCRL